MTSVHMTTLSTPDPAHRHESALERLRLDDLLRLLPAGGDTALDVGARDGAFARLLAGRFSRVTALDLVAPRIEHPRVACLQGDVTDLQIPGDSHDLVVCTEVLEHIDPGQVQLACSELARVCRSHLLIGVPYEQDIRVGRTTCRTCGMRNPPWGHVNSFSHARLLALFPGLTPLETSYVGETRDGTNALSTVLMDLAGNPYGTYGQEETCIRCGAQIESPPPRGLIKKALTASAFVTRAATRPLTRSKPRWMHVLFGKSPRLVERMSLS